jgi:hypothetical protein
MPDLPGASRYPLEIDSVECSPMGADKLVVYVSGTWRGRRRSTDGRPVLVVEAEDRRHRFPAIPEPRRSRIGRPGAWSASFAVPASLEPRLKGQMSLWLGNVAIPMPPVAFVASDVGPRTRPQPPRTRDAADEPGSTTDRAAGGEPDDPDQHDAPPAKPVTGNAQRLPQTVAALRAELRERTASEAELRALLARAQAELETRSGSRGDVELTHRELRAELDRLATQVAEQISQRAEIESKAVVMAAQMADLEAELRELRSEIAEVEASRDGAEGLVAGLRAELDRTAAELAATPSDAGAEDDELDEAKALLAEARALTSRIRGRRAGSEAEPAETK